MTESVLIVEDEGLVGLDLRLRVEALGYRVVGLADTAAEAVELARAHRPSVVLMDIRLRGEADGVDAAAEISTRFSAPVVFVTGNTDEATLRRATNAEPYGYLVKPVDDRELEATLKTALRRHRAEASLRQLERWLTTTLHSITDAVLVTDLAGKVCFLNHAAEALTGWRLGEALGRFHLDVVPRADQPPHAQAQALARIMTSQVPMPLEEGAVLRRHDGALVPVRGTWTAALDEGEITGAVLVLRAAPAPTQPRM